MFPRDRFEAIYHTMMHASEIEAKAKNKIDYWMERTLEIQAVHFI
jgi:hypothetical protein